MTLLERPLEVHRRPLDIREAAEYLGTTERHMRRLRDRREVPGFKVGGKVRFDPDKLDAYLTARANDDDVTG